jgi:hypothetical protein
MEAIHFFERPTNSYMASQQQIMYWSVTSHLFSVQLNICVGLFIWRYCSLHVVLSGFHSCIVSVYVFILTIVTSAPKMEAEKSCEPTTLKKISKFVQRKSTIFCVVTSCRLTPQLCSRNWVDPVPDPLLLWKSGRAGNRTRTSGSVARNSDH